MAFFQKGLLNVQILSDIFSPMEQQIYTSFSKAGQELKKEFADTMCAGPSAGSSSGCVLVTRCVFMVVM